MEISHIYNPANQSKKELVGNFVIRKMEFRQIMSVIKDDNMENPPQHYIIQGQRGSGKTTLLRRIFYEVSDDSNLNNWLIPIIFPEEQPQIRTLWRFWTEIAYYLAENIKGFEGIDDKINEFELNNYIEEKTYEILIQALHDNNRKILLLLDNFGNLFKKFSRKEQQRLREVFLTCSDIRIIGASTVVLEHFFKYDNPFYEFFKIIHLKELTKEEVISLLLQFENIYQTGTVSKIIEQHPERIEALRRLTGGVPRTIALLFGIFSDNLNGDSFKDLEAVLDKVTPLYKHRIDKLPKNQQAITHTIAMNWDAISVKELSKKLKMQSKIISAQLLILVKNNIVKKIQTSSKNHLYQINERFFNIWYLMRYGSKKDRNRVHFLVRFFEIWLSKDEIYDLANRHIENLKTKKIYNKYAYLMSEAIVQFVPDSSLILNTKEEVESEFKEEPAKYGNIQNNDNEIIQKINDHLSKIEYEAALKLTEKLKSPIDRYINKACVNIRKQDFKEAESHLLKAIEYGDNNSIYLLARLYEKDLENPQKSKEYYLKIESASDRYPNAMYNLARLYHLEFKDYENAEKYYYEASKNGYPDALIDLLLMLFLEKSDKEITLNYAIEFNNKYKSFQSKIFYSIMLLWNNEIDKVLIFSSDIFKDKGFDTTFNYFFEKGDSLNFYLLKCFLLLLLAKKQYHFSYNMYININQLKNEFKPFYYATLHFLGNEYKDEYLKMGSELKETVEEIIEEVKRYEVEYA